MLFARVPPMADQEEHGISNQMGCRPICVDTAGALRCGGRIVFWIQGVRLIEGPDFTVVSSEHGCNVWTAKTTCTPPLDAFLEVGARRLVNTEEPFARFDRPVRRAAPSPRRLGPPGHRRGSSAALSP